jgi:hypothetical protein
LAARIAAAKNAKIGRDRPVALLKLVVALAVIGVAGYIAWHIQVLKGDMSMATFGAVLVGMGVLLLMAYQGAVGFYKKKPLEIPPDVTFFAAAKAAVKAMVVAIILFYGVHAYFVSAAPVSTNAINLDGRGFQVAAIVAIALLLWFIWQNVLVVSRFNDQRLDNNRLLKIPEQTIKVG